MEATNNEFLENLNLILGATLVSPSGIRIKQNTSKTVTVINYDFKLGNYQLKKLLELGEVEINRSGAGLRIELTTIK